MLRRAVLHRDSFRRPAGVASDSRSSPHFSPEAPLGDLPRILEKMTAADIDSVLRLIAKQARLVTAASGAAIALGSNHHYFCRASAGDTAPPVGVPIRSDSGLTGECIHRRVSLRCDDSEKDDRVDAAACRELQVRSIVVVPVRMGDDLAGVLEVFSNHVSAFTNSHLATLERIAGLISEVCERAAQLIVAAADDSAAGEETVASATSTIPESPSTTSAASKRGPAIAATASRHAATALAWSRAQVALLQRQPKLWLVASAAAVLLVVSLALILGRKHSAPKLQESQAVTEPTSPSVTVSPNSSPVQSSPPVDSTLAAPTSTPVPEKSSKPAAAIPPSSQPADDDVVVLRVPPGNRASAPPQQSLVAESAPPEISDLSALGSSPGPGILTASVVTPKLAEQPAPVSQGVVAGRLIRKINPVYPLPAREARLQGQVVLSVVVQKNGKVGKVRVISGHPMLAKAAVQAIKGWIYEPFRLNGQPTDAEAQVTINFKE